MPPILVALATTAILSSAHTQAAPAQGNCRTVKGKFVARIVKPCAAAICTNGNLSGGLEGTYEFETTKDPIPAKDPKEPDDPAPPTVMFFVGRSTVTLKSGGVLVGIDTGAVDMPPGQGGFASLITWTERDGLKNVSGQIRLRGTVNLAPGTASEDHAGMTSGDYDGNLCGEK